MRKKPRHLTNTQFYYTLKSISENDCYLMEFFDEDILQEFLECLIDYDIVFIASDDRILLTPYGEKILQKLTFLVEFSYADDKIYKK